MSNSKPSTFQIVKSDTFEIRVDLAIPPTKPVMRGHITLDAYPLTREQIRDLSDKGLTDEEYLRTLVANIRGLGDENGPLEGDAAFHEVLEGRYSMWLLPAVLGAFFEDFGQARRKNGGPLRGR